MTQNTASTIAEPQQLPELPELPELTIESAPKPTGCTETVVREEMITQEPQMEA